MMRCLGVKFCTVFLPFTRSPDQVQFHVGMKKHNEGIFLHDKSSETRHCQGKTMTKQTMEDIDMSHSPLEPWIEEWECAGPDA